MATDAARTRVLRTVGDQFDAHGPRAGALHRYTRLDCGHLIDHGPCDQIDRPLPGRGTLVCCRRCTNAARGRG